MGNILLTYQRSATCNSRAALKSTLDFTEIVSEWKWKRGTVCLLSCQIYFPIVIGEERHIKILKCFHNELMCCVASDYHENNEAKGYFGQKCLVTLPK